MTPGMVAGLLRLLTGARSTWTAQEPSVTPSIYFANHTSHLDAAVLWAALPRAIREKTRPVAAADYWEKNGLRRFLAKRVFNALLIERKNVTHRTNPIPLIVEELDKGWSIIIFPEGTRSDGPEPREFKSGLYHLAKARPNVPLIPVYLENFNRILPKGEFLPAPLLATVMIGAPLQLRPDQPKAEFMEQCRQRVWELHRL
jgi:1-acyl-sn-glycerol-3-phosphate acyltransferase